MIIPDSIVTTFLYVNRLTTRLKTYDTNYRKQVVWSITIIQSEYFLEGTNKYILVILQYLCRVSNNFSMSTLSLLYSMAVVFNLPRYWPCERQPLHRPEGWGVVIQPLTSGGGGSWIGDNSMWIHWKSCVQLWRTRRWLGAVRCTRGVVRHSSAAAGTVNIFRAKSEAGRRVAVQARSLNHPPPIAQHTNRMQVLMGQLLLNALLFRRNKALFQ